MGVNSRVNNGYLKGRARADIDTNVRILNQLRWPKNKVDVVIDTETYKKALSGSIAMTGTNVDFILKGINEYLMALAKEQIKLAFEQSEKEVADLHQRTREGLLTARLNGKQVGRKKGIGFETKKAREAKQIIRTHCKTFGGTLDDAECMKLTGLARNTYYKYKRQIRAELMAEQDLPKGASIFYEPPKSF